jgi:hypothetical protein
MQELMDDDDRDDVALLQGTGESGDIPGAASRA